MIQAAIDLGSNTCLLLIAKCSSEDGAIQEVIADEMRVVRLGEGVSLSKSLSEAAMQRAIEALKEYAQQVRTLGANVHKTKCVATAQARAARNWDTFQQRVLLETGFQFSVLSGTEEAMGSFQGALLEGMKPEDSVVIDIGGGSTEWASDTDYVSTTVGCVSLTEAYGLHKRQLDSSQLAAATEALRSEFFQARPEKFAFGELRKNLVGVAGTVTTLAAWDGKVEEFDVSQINGRVLSQDRVQSQLDQLAQMDTEERARCVGIDPKRADVILAGALILKVSMELLGFSEITVSAQGLRYFLLTTSAR